MTQNFWFVADLFLTRVYERYFLLAIVLSIHNLHVTGPSRAPVRGSAVPDGLPKINPLAFSRNMKHQEEKNLQDIKEVARKQQSAEEMWKPPSKIKENLYDGFTKEGKGRHQYLRERHGVIPEKKFSFPMLSSWEYGWKIDEAFNLQRPKHARTRLIQDRFYTRNRIPTLEDPTIGPTIERAKTILF